MKFVQPKRVLIAVLVCKHSGSTLKISNKEQGAFRQNPKGSVWAIFLLLYRSLIQNYCTTLALHCINTAQLAAKVYSKDQQTLKLFTSLGPITIHQVID